MPVRGGCEHDAANWSALRTSVHGVTGCGAFQRRSPTGGAANGMPLKTLTDGSSPRTPSIAPVSVRTMSGLTVGGAGATGGRAAEFGDGGGWSVRGAGRGAVRGAVVVVGAGVGVVGAGGAGRCAISRPETENARATRHRSQASRPGDGENGLATPFDCRPR